MSACESLPILEGATDYEPISFDDLEFNKQAIDKTAYEPTPIVEVVEEYEPIPLVFNEPRVEDLSWIVQEPLMTQYLPSWDLDSNIMLAVQ